MKQTKIYVKGTTGFKPPVKSKLGDAWVYSDVEQNADTLLLLLSDASQLETLKSSIGEDLIAVYELKFLNSPDEPSVTEVTRTPGLKDAMKMSIWI